MAVVVGVRLRLLLSLWLFSLGAGAPTDQDHVSLMHNLVKGEQRLVDVEVAADGTLSDVRQSRSLTVGLLVFATLDFQEKYSGHLQSLACYGERHGYQLHVLDSATRADHARLASSGLGAKRSLPPRCAPLRDEFFQKQCMVAEFLRAQAPGYTAVVLDADVNAVVFDRSLERWLRTDADLQFYSRCWGPEFAAGNYIARNTPFAINFLTRWASYEQRVPPGFSSHDNGALGLQLLHATRLKGARRCVKMYERLRAPFGEFFPYFKYWTCVRKALGSPGTWSVRNEDGEGTLMLWPRLQFFVADAWVLNFSASLDAGPVMHHENKAPRDLCKYYDGLSSCKLSASQLLPAATLGDIAAEHSERFCLHCDATCHRAFNCSPTAMRQAGHRSFRAPSSTVATPALELGVATSAVAPWDWKENEARQSLLWSEESICKASNATLGERPWYHVWAKKYKQWADASLL